MADTFLGNRDGKEAIMTTSIPPHELRAMERRCEAATEGPLRVVGCGEHWTILGGRQEIGRLPPKQHADALLFSHSRIDMPRLIAEVRKLRSLLVSAHRMAALCWDGRSKRIKPTACEICRQSLGEDAAS